MAQKTEKKISNPGSKLGEEIGNAFEAAAHRVIERIGREHGCLLRTAGAKNKKGKPTQLRVKDRAENAYSIDGIIVNRANQPLVVIEVKYIRYKKHNNDEKWNGWECPYFSFEEGARIVQVHNELIDIKSSYQELTDRFVFEFSDGVEEYGSIFLEGQKFYQIGSGAWIWEEVQRND